jgi:hypothetical protein
MPCEGCEDFAALYARECVARGELLILEHYAGRLHNNDSHVYPLKTLAKLLTSI